MKFILSFLLTTALLSASTSYKLSVGHAALDNHTLLCQTNTTPSLAIKSNELSLPFAKQSDISAADKCVPGPTFPVIDCPTIPTPKCPTLPPRCDPAPEPASLALLGVGLFTAGVARNLRKKK